MKKVILDISEMSDSKEVYSQRPNPFIRAFIYSIIALLLVALIYSFVGKIEMVSSSKGFVRPNDDVSTVASPLSGRLESVSFYDGQIVKAGDELFSIDTSEAEITLNGLLDSQADLQQQIQMTEKFLDGISTGNNPFSSAQDSEEYPYYVQYQDYALSLKNSKVNITFDKDKTEATISTLENQIANLENKVEGLTKYKASVQQGKNLLSGYPDYEKMYLLYVSTLDGLQNEHDAQIGKIERDTTEQSNQYYSDYYTNQITQYEYLIQSIESGHSCFPESEDSIYKLMYEEYLSNLSEYKRTYESAKETYQYYQNGGSTGNSDSALYAYDEARLEGYRYFKQALEQGKDVLKSGNDNAVYRALYADYIAQKDTLSNTVKQAENTYRGYKSDYDDIVSQISSKEKQIETIRAEMAAKDAEAAAAESEGGSGIPVDHSAALAEIAALEQSIETLKNQKSALSNQITSADDQVGSAESASTAYKETTLATTEATILQIESNIEEKKVSYGAYSLGYNTETARIQMDSAEAAIDTYRKKVLEEYRQMLQGLRDKMNELAISSTATQPKEDMIAELSSSYNTSREQQYYQTVTQIDSNLDTLKSELDTAKSNLKLNQITMDVYKNSKDKNGEDVSVSLATINKASTLLDNETALNQQLDELETNIQKTKTQISQATVLAKQSGTVSVINKVVSGDLINSGTVVATIIPNDESEYKVQLYVSSSDIANIEVGDKIKYNVSALPSNQYGTIDGVVTSISSDMMVQNGEYSGYFLVEGSIEGGELTDKDGNTGMVTIGMDVQAKIVTQEKSIIRYLLEKINLF